MMILNSVRIIPVLHGRIAIAKEVRRICNEEEFDALLLPLSVSVEEELISAVEELPIISAITVESSEQAYILPIDPTDAFIEAARQASQKHLPIECLGPETPHKPALMINPPDEESIESIGLDAWASLVLHNCELTKSVVPRNELSDFLAYELRDAAQRYQKALFPVEIHMIPALLESLQDVTERPVFNPEYLTIRRSPVEVNKLYFILGELPFVAGEYEKNRFKLFEEKLSATELIKKMFLETRDNFIDSPGQQNLFSITRLQQGLTFLRNLTLQENKLTPSLFNILTAAKGVGGDSFALKILKAANFYPYLPIGHAPSELLSVGLSGEGQILIKRYKEDLRDAVHLLKDTQTEWKTITIKPDKETWRDHEQSYRWTMENLCSHTPEDIYIENFNKHVRGKSLKILNDQLKKSEEFATSFKDGLDIRETMRNWHTGKIYVHEVPQVNSGIDTIVVIFDEDHDMQYPILTTWYAEHKEESTLSFYSKNPLKTLVGPGIAECEYGGFTLLYPPQQTPDIAQYVEMRKLDRLPLNYQLTLYAMNFSQERVIAYISDKRPSSFLLKKAKDLHKNLLWIPMKSFSSDTLRRLRKFHMLDGKKVRSWASRFIGD